MKLSVKKMLLACIFASFSIILISMLQVHVTKHKAGSRMTAREFKTTEWELKNSVVSSQDATAFKTGLTDSLKTEQTKLKQVVKNYSIIGRIETVSQNISTLRKKTTSEIFSPVPFENHLLVHSPRKEFAKASKTEAQTPMCPTASPLLKGHIDVQLLSKLNFMVLCLQFY